MVHGQEGSVGVSLLGREGAGNLGRDLFSNDWVCLVILIPVNGFFANVHGCGVGAGVIMPGVGFVPGIVLGVEEIRELGGNTIRNDGESGNQPIEGMALVF